MTSKMRTLHCTPLFNIFYANIHRLALVKGILVIIYTAMSTSIFQSFLTLLNLIIQNE